jgi:hypothetical protein
VIGSPAVIIPANQLILAQPVEVFRDVLVPRGNNGGYGTAETWGSGVPDVRFVTLGQLFAPFAVPAR